MKAIASLRVPVLDLDGYRLRLHEHMTQVLKEATTKWLESTAHYVPVWSGASRATFSPLASQVEYALSISPVVPSRESIGLDNATGLFETNTTPGLYTFTYITTLPWLIINENYDARQWGFHLKNPGPYHFQRRGDTAVRMYSNGITLPDLRPFIHSVVI